MASTRESWARFWAVDLHTHTPGSGDARDADFGAPSDIVSAALAAGLDAIAVTDHNTVSWVERMGEAAAGTELIILPGVELSTPEGHLLGIWEERTPARLLEDFLIKVGIQRSDFGNLDIVTACTLSECAQKIAKAGGVAILAHIDKEKGILKHAVQAHVNALLSDSNISALEHVHADAVTRVEAKLGFDVSRAFVKSSDAYDASLSRHSSTGIGVRRTWVKASRPDLRGLRHALEDPQLRVRTDRPSEIARANSIESVRISGGFLGGAEFALSPDLNCLLGGTGAGKSLVLEAIRFALDQQVDASIFGAIGDEVRRRLESALGEGTQVSVQVISQDDHYRVVREFSSSGSAPTVQQRNNGEWITIGKKASELLPLAAFSQGEVLEYAREPVGRVTLLDAHIDLSAIQSSIDELESQLAANALLLIEGRSEVDRLSTEASSVSELTERERELSDLFDAGLVKQQGAWTNEQSAFDSLEEALSKLRFPSPKMPAHITVGDVLPHSSQIDRVNAALLKFAESAGAAQNQIATDLGLLRSEISAVREELNGEFSAFKATLDEALVRSGGDSLASLRRELEAVQARLGRARIAATRLEETSKPALAASDRSRLVQLETLRSLRSERRKLRRERAKLLNAKTAGFVKVDVPSRGDSSEFRLALNELKVGSRVQERILDAISTGISPYKLARALWTGDFSVLDPLPEGVQMTDISRLHANIADRDLWEQVLSLQTVDTPDLLNVSFKKPESGDYARIEDLSHGQKCTAILVILLADGTSPVLIDQPEDALHAPWIEDYLVDRLRDLRGSRQYIFATRSPGLVVSADAEQLVIMRATSIHGEVERTGSLERHDLNHLALHHLEGGQVPFARRSKKLASSLHNFSS